MDKRSGGFRPVDTDALGIRDPHVEIDITVAHPARVYDYLLGGKNNYPADRTVGDHMVERVPTIVDEVRANRQFLRRSVRAAAREGITQFLDIGTGIPTAGPTHETAHAIDPGARVVYIDNDPIVLVQSRALLVDDNLTTVARADARDPAAVLDHARAHLDFTKPIALMFVGLLYFITDEDLAGVLEQYLAAMSEGSYLLITHALDTPNVKKLAEVYETTSPAVFRSAERIHGLFGDWDLLDPGVVPLHEWRPDGDELVCREMLGGMAVKTARPAAGRGG